MRPGPLLPALIAAVALAACGDSRRPDSPNPGGDDVVTVRGTERLGWDQQAASRTELGAVRFAVYVDGARNEMPDVTCEGNAGSAGFPCSGRLPSMSSGLHTLELAAYVMDGSRVLESPRSPPLRVNVSPALSAPANAVPAAPPRSSSGREASSSSSAIQPAADEFERIAAAIPFREIAGIAVAADGSLIVAEREGVLRTIHLDAAGGDSSAIAVDGTVAAGDAGMVVDVAVPADFARTRFVYVLQTAAAREGLTWQLARYRQAGDVFGERALLLQTGDATPDSTGVVRVGSDGRLYIALEDERGSAMRRSGDQRESVILRLNPDGSTPSDQLSGSPVYAVVPGVVSGLDWNPRTGAPWVAFRESDRARVTALAVDARGRRAGPAGRDTAIGVPASATAIAFYRGDAIPAWRDSLLIGAEDGLRRARLDVQQERIVAVDSVGDAPVRAAAAGPGGQLFIATAEAVFRARQP